MTGEAWCSMGRTLSPCFTEEYHHTIYLFLYHSEWSVQRLSNSQLWKNQNLETHNESMQTVFLKFVSNLRYLSRNNCRTNVIPDFVNCFIYGRPKSSTKVLVPMIFVPIFMSASQSKRTCGRIWRNIPLMELLIFMVRQDGTGTRSRKPAVKYTGGLQVSAVISYPLNGMLIPCLNSVLIGF